MRVHENCTVLQWTLWILSSHPILYRQTSSLEGLRNFVSVEPRSQDEAPRLPSAPWRKHTEELWEALLAGRVWAPWKEGRTVTLLTKVHIVKAMVFPVVMYGCESWTIIKAECQRINAFECGAGEDS